MYYLNKNMKLLRQFDRRLFNRVSEWLTEENLNYKFSIVKGKNGEPSLQYLDGEKIKFLTSAYNSRREGKLWAERVKESKAFVVYGFGLGYHLAELAKKDGVKSIFVVEPNKEVFCLALKYLDLEWLFTNEIFQLSVAEEEKSLNAGLNFLIRKVYNEFEYTSFNNYSLIFNDDYTRFIKLLNEVVGAYILEVNTFSFFGKQWTDNFFENLYPTLINPGIKGLFGKFKNLPTVIISAGPSLNKNIHLLEELKGKALLLCVGTAYKALKKNGIKPDLIVSFDGSYKNYKIFEGLNVTDIPLVYDPTIHHKIIKEYRGPLIPANVTSGFLDWFEKQLNISKGRLLVGASIANVTFDIARKLGGNPIIFVGQDLAYTDGQTHAKGTIYEGERVKANGNLMEVYVEDIHGNQVLSNRSFLMFLQWFENQIEKTKDRLFIDATEGGARIHGTEIMPLAQVIEKYCQKEYPITETINNFLAEKRPCEKEIAEKGLKILKTIKGDLSQFNKKAKKGLRLINELQILFKRPETNQKRINKILRELDKIDKKIVSYENGKVFLQIIFQPLVLPLLNGPDSKPKKGETEEESYARIIRFNRNLYDGLNEISKVVMEMVEKTEKDFTARLSRVCKEVEQC